MDKKLRPSISRRNWIVMLALALTGQIAWAVENSWFNTFVFDVITPDPRPVAWMVAVSAVTATLTTLLMGTLSDRTQNRWGKRRPYILLGYILWGLSTIAFPTVAYIRTTSVAVLMVVIMDSVMTFFGSTANDAAFNAWTVDIADTDARGRVEGVLNLSLFLAQIVALVAAGSLIDRFGYFVFFYALGGIVALVGLIGGLLLEEPQSVSQDEKRTPFWQELRQLFDLRTIKENSTLFILLVFMMISGIGMQVSFPYMIVYLENNVGVSKTEFSIIGGAVMLGSALLAIPFGILADRWRKRAMIAIGLVVSSMGGIMFSLVRSLGLLAIAGLLWQAFSVAAGIASTAWLKDLLPEESRGKFLGIRMIFWVMMPMVVGPAIGSWLIQSFGIPTHMGGEAGFIPVPIIFQVGSIISLLALIPLVFTKDKKPVLDAE